MWTMEGFSARTRKPNGRHVRIDDVGTAGWEVIVTFHADPEATKRRVFATWREAQTAALHVATA